MITKKFILGLITGVAFSSMLLSAAPKSTKNLSWDEKAALEKADYYYLKGLGYYATDSLGNLFQTINRAAVLSPNDNDINSIQARMYMMMLSESDNDFEKYYNKLMACYKANPSDIELGDFASNIAVHERRFDDAVTVVERQCECYPDNNDFQLRLANLYTIQAYMGDTTAVAGAQRIYDKLEAAYGMNLGLASNKIRTYDMLGDSTAIINELNVLSRELSEDPTVHHYVGSIYERMGNESQAIASYKRAGEVDPSYTGAAADLARLYLKKGDLEMFKSEAHKTLTSNEVTDKDGLSLLNDYINVISQDSLTIEQERELFRPISEINMTESRVHGMIGSHYMQRKAITDGIDAFETAYAINKDDAMTVAFYISALYNNDQKERAYNVTIDASKHLNQTPQFILEAAAMLSEQGRHKEALDLKLNYDTSNFTTKEGLASLKTSIGDTYWALDSMDRAIEYYEEAIALDTSSFMAYNNAAYMLAVTNGDLDKALKYARIAYLGASKYPTFIDTYAWVYFKRKDYESAKTYIDKTLSESLNQIEEAKQNEALDAIDFDDDSDDSSIFDVSADEPSADVQEPDSVKAEASLVDRVMDNADKFEKDILDHAGDIYFMNGEPADALRFWEAALKLDPEDKALKKKVKNKTYFFE